MSRKWRNKIYKFYWFSSQLFRAEDFDELSAVLNDYPNGLKCLKTHWKTDESKNQHCPKQPVLWACDQSYARLAQLLPQQGQRPTEIHPCIALLNWWTTASYCTAMRVQTAKVSRFSSQITTSRCAFFHNTILSVVPIWTWLFNCVGHIVRKNSYSQMQLWHIKIWFPSINSVLIQSHRNSKLSNRTGCIVRKKCFFVTFDLCNYIDTYYINIHLFLVWK